MKAWGLEKNNYLEGRINIYRDNGWKVVYNICKKQNTQTD